MRVKLSFAIFFALVLSFTANSTFGDMVAYYPMDEGAGTLIKDYSGYGHEAEAQAEPNWVDSAPNFGKAIYFDGTDPTPYYIDCGTWNPSEETGELSIGCWIKWDGENGNWQGIMGKRDGWEVPIGGTAPTMWYLEVSTSGDMKFSSKGDVITDVQFGVIPPVGEWIHVGVSFDGTDISTYVDGEKCDSEIRIGGTPDETAKFVFGPGTDNTIVIGCDNNGGANAFWGTIDEVRLFDNALSQEDIQDIMFDVGLPPGLSRAPKPKDTKTEVQRDKNLRWKGGMFVDTHDLYFGEDFNDVNQATPDDPRGVLIQTGMTEASYEIPGLFEFEKTYYWRVDEVNDADPNSPWKGRVWSFTIANYDLIDDFEEYDNEDNIIYETWNDYYVNNTGMTVGYLEPSYAEYEEINGGKVSMPLHYDNDGTVNEGTDLETSGTSYYSEAELELPEAQDWTLDGLDTLSFWFKGYPAEDSGFMEDPAGTYTIVGMGEDIWSTSDAFHFAYKEVSGTVKITARVDSIEEGADPFAKAGVMIRDTLDPDAKNCSVLMTPGNGVRYQYRTSAGGGTERLSDANVAVPYWVRLERTSGGLIRAYYSENGSDWTNFKLKQVSMTMPIYIGLAVSSHDASVSSEAVFSNVSFPDTTVSDEWLHQDIGVKINEPQPMYVVLNGVGPVYHDDPNASLISTWTEWNIPLQSFADNGVDLTNVTSLGIGVGTIDSQEPCGEGRIFIDDIRLYIPRDTD